MPKATVVEFLVCVSGGILVLAFAVLLSLASGCASSGLYQMSDEWCARHAEASPARCSRNPLKEYDVQGHQLAGQQPDFTTCPHQYTYGAYGVTITCWGQQ